MDHLLFQGHVHPETPQRATIVPPQYNDDGETFPVFQSSKSLSTSAITNYIPFSNPSPSSCLSTSDDKISIPPLPGTPLFNSSMHDVSSRSVDAMQSTSINPHQDGGPCGSGDISTSIRVVLPPTSPIEEVWKHRVFAASRVALVRRRYIHVFSFFLSFFY
jgi:hypothetical protein